MSDSIRQAPVPPQRKGPQRAEGKEKVGRIPQMPVVREEILYRFAAGARPQYLAHKIGHTSPIAIESVIRDAVREYRAKIAELKAQLIRAAMQPQWRTA